MSLLTFFVPFLPWTPDAVGILGKSKVKIKAVCNL